MAGPWPMQGIGHNGGQRPPYVTRYINVTVTRKNRIIRIQLLGQTTCIRCIFTNSKGNIEFISIEIALQSLVLNKNTQFHRRFGKIAQNIRYISLSSGIIERIINHLSDILRNICVILVAQVRIIRL